MSITPGMLLQRVYIEPRDETGVDGRPSSYEAGEYVEAKVEPYYRNLLTAEGERTVSKARLFLPGDVEVETGDKITLPDGTSGPILQIGTTYDGVGDVDHKVVVI